MTGPRYIHEKREIKNGNSKVRVDTVTFKKMLCLYFIVSQHSQIKCKGIKISLETNGWWYCMWPSKNHKTQTKQRATEKILGKQNTHTK